jgi:hypothetical protein
MAAEEGCTEAVTGAQFDTAAAVLAALGEVRAALRMSGAADTTRGDLPRTLPERADDDAVRAAAAAVLPPQEAARERARGAGWSRQEAGEELAGLARTSD